MISPWCNKKKQDYSQSKEFQDLSALDPAGSKGGKYSRVLYKRGVKTAEVTFRSVEVGF